MDVGEEERPRLALEARQQGLEARRGARIDDHPVHLVGADHPVAAQVHDVDQIGHRDEATRRVIRPRLESSVAGEPSARDRDPIPGRQLARPGPLGRIRSRTWRACSGRARALPTRPVAPDLQRRPLGASAEHRGLEPHRAPCRAREPGRAPPPARGVRPLAVGRPVASGTLGPGYRFGFGAMQDTNRVIARLGWRPWRPRTSEGWPASSHHPIWLPGS